MGIINIFIGLSGKGIAEIVKKRPSKAERIWYDFDATHYKAEAICRKLCVSYSELKEYILAGFPFESWDHYEQFIEEERKIEEYWKWSYREEQEFEERQRRVVEEFRKKEARKKIQEEKETKERLRQLEEKRIREAAAWEYSIKNFPTLSRTEQAKVLCRELRLQFVDANVIMQWWGQELSNIKGKMKKRIGDKKAEECYIWLKQYHDGEEL